MKLLTVVVTFALVGQACSSPGQMPPELTEMHGCGFGFFLSDADQTVGLFVEYADHERARSGDLAPTSQLTDDVWNAELRFGTDLFANWCDDVLEPGEPTPEVDATWDVSGSVTFTELPARAGCGLGSATAGLHGLTATDAEGETMELGDIEVENEFWGCIAG